MLCVCFALCVCCAPPRFYVCVRLALRGVHAVCLLYIANIVWYSLNTQKHIVCQRTYDWDESRERALLFMRHFRNYYVLWIQEFACERAYMRSSSNLRRRYTNWSKWKKCSQRMSILHYIRSLCFMYTIVIASIVHIISHTCPAQHNSLASECWALDANEKL